MEQPAAHPEANHEPSAEYTASDLIALLETYGVPHHQWGSGHAKSLTHLLRELQLGESRLEVIQQDDGQERLHRHTSVAAVDVYYRDPDTGTHLRLVEDRQEFVDGRTRTRPHTIASLGEKVKPGETAVAAAVRAVEEELGFTPPAINPVHDEIITQQSLSYPGLPTTYTIAYSACDATAAAYRPDGYVEYQPDKTTYFVWVEIDPDDPSSPLTK